MMGSWGELLWSLVQFNGLEWGAMLLVTLQLVLVSRRQLYWSWVICLMACCLWAGVAFNHEMWGLLGQQGIIAAVAVFGFIKESRRGARGALPTGLEGGKNYYITEDGQAIPHDDSDVAYEYRHPDDDYGGSVPEPKPELI